MSDLAPPVFNGTVAQCQDVIISWQGGQFPVRVESFYQEDRSSDWKSTPGMPSEAANSNVISWKADVPAGSYAWITLVDHTGTYRQVTEPALVETSDDASCLDSARTAEFVTQTVYMNPNGVATNRGSALDSRSLLIVAVLFGVLFFAALAGALYLYSLLNNARRARLRGPRRFNLVDDDASSFAGSEGLGGGATVAAAGAAGMAAAAGVKRHRRVSSLSDTSDFVPTAAFADKNRQYEKEAPSPTSTHGENNPFLDPPLPTAATLAYTRRPSEDARSLASVRTYDSAAPGPRSMPQMAAFPSYPAGRQQSRPVSARAPSESGTLSSATSMQLFGTTGGLRVTNDPANISTPTLSRAVTNASSVSRYPDSTSEEVSPPGTGLAGSSGPEGQVGGEDQATSMDLARQRAISDNGTLVSEGSTLAHYASEPHSSRGWISK